MAPPKKEKTHPVLLKFPLSDFAELKAAADEMGIPYSTFCRVQVKKALREIKQVA